RSPFPEPYTVTPQPSTLNPQPSTLNPQPSTLNPQPRKSERAPPPRRPRGLRGRVRDAHQDDGEQHAHGHEQGPRDARARRDRAGQRRGRVRRQDCVVQRGHRRLAGAVPLPYLLSSQTFLAQTSFPPSSKPASSPKPAFLGTQTCYPASSRVPLYPRTAVGRTATTASQVLPYTCRTLGLSSPTPRLG
ncbi:hypothetical protein T484DRAFT_1634891, partial [Baffinella frigidus]